VLSTLHMAVGFVVLVVLVLADTLLRILHYCPISPCFQHITLLSYFTALVDYQSSEITTKLLIDNCDIYFEKLLIDNLDTYLKFRKQK
jgi:hypothetical protein